VCVVGVWQHEIWTCGVCFWCGELRTTVSYITENIVCVCYEHQAMILSEMIFIVAVMQNT